MNTTPVGPERERDRHSLHAKEQPLARPLNAKSRPVERLLRYRWTYGEEDQTRTTGCSAF
jgi:hypothetical protein